MSALNQTSPAYGTSCSLYPVLPPSTELPPPTAPTMSTPPRNSQQLEGRRNNMQTPGSPGMLREPLFEEINFGQRKYAAWKSGLEKTGITSLIIGIAGTLFSGVLIPAIRYYPAHFAWLSSASKIAALPVLKIMVPSLIVLALGAGLYSVGCKLIAYDDKKTWTNLRTIILPQLNFEQVVSQYGLKIVHDWHLLSVEALQDKYHAWVREREPTEIVSLDDLLLYQIIDRGEYDRLSRIKEDAVRAFTDKQRHLELRDNLDREMGFSERRTKQVAFRKRMRNMNCQDLFTLYPDPWTLALERTISTKDYERLVELKKQLDAARKDKNEILKVEDRYNALYKPRPAAQEPRRD